MAGDYEAAVEAAPRARPASWYRDLGDHEAEIRRLVDSNIIGVIFWNLEGRIIELQRPWRAC